MRTSVIIPNYNYADFLPLAIDSLLAQSVAVDEIIVVDDGSTDHSRKVIEGYGDAVIGVFQDNQGQASALNAGFERSTGDIVFILDADDLFAVNKVEIIKGLYADYPDIPWIFHRLRHVDRKTAEAEKDRSCPYDVKDERIINEVERIKRGKTKYDAPATSGLSFRRDFMARIFPLPVAHSIYISDHYIKFLCLSLSSGLHLGSGLGSQIIHDNNLYTGQKALATRAQIFISTATCLKDKNPDLWRFCNLIFEEGLICSYRASLSFKLERPIQKYKDTMSNPERFVLALRLIVKKVLGRY